MALECVSIREASLSMARNGLHSDVEATAIVVLARLREAAQLALANGSDELYYTLEHAMAGLEAGITMR